MHRAWRDHDTVASIITSRASWIQVIHTLASKTALGARRHPRSIHILPAPHKATRDRPVHHVGIDQGHSRKISQTERLDAGIRGLASLVRESTAHTHCRSRRDIVLALCGEALVSRRHHQTPWRAVSKKVVEGHELRDNT